MFNRKNGYHILQFRATRVTTQGGLISPEIFNVAVENVVRHWLPMTVEYETVTNGGLRHAVGQSMLVLYTNDSLIG